MTGAGHDPGMKITFKLFATLTDHLPPEARRSNQIELDVAPDAPISGISAAGSTAACTSAAATPHRR